jgi:hypothetical protein
MPADDAVYPDAERTAAVATPVDGREKISIQ